MKKTISLLLCVIMVMAIATCAFAKLPAGGIPIGGGTTTDPTADFKAMVEGIGEVTLEDKEAIEEAEAELDRLKTLAGKAWALQYASALEQWTTALEDARTEYDALVAAQNQPPKTGDGTMVFVALAMLSMTAMVVMVAKKKAY